MKNHLFRHTKTLLIAFLLWFFLTSALVALDHFFVFTQRFNWFPAIGVLLPAVSAVLYIASALFKPRIQKSRIGRQPARKPSAAERPDQNVPLFPTGDPKVDKVMAIVDTMDGHDFEQFCAEVLQRCNYQNIHVTRDSGDQGVDIIAIKYGVRYAFQCKRYSSKLGNKPVQEVHTGKQFYSCQTGVVITNNYFTRGAEDAARRVGVQLWDRDTLIRKMGWGK